ncbi:hypothetical protein COV17_04235 [Candidatus Woesearchaeota archaeon CG10_big_fil_rev_8_21_14_0_10_36_11]|nr:MAG: hypothetical protein COV17_04235 [Candidatus Woesearchaeota archaeon CG10_big_fil_rev_8_21_14_0_10_36_11]
MGVVKVYGKHVRRVFAGKSPSDDNSFYSKKKRELLVEEDALNYEEDGFMEGYEADYVENNEGNNNLFLDGDIQRGII